MANLGELPAVVVIWDFANVLSPSPLDPLLDRFNADRAEFWENVSSLSRDKSYLDHIVRHANGGHFEGLNNYLLGELGPDIVLYDGLPDFLGTLKAEVERATTGQVQVRHYVVSNDLLEMIRGSRISPYLSGIHACGFTTS